MSPFAMRNENLVVNRSTVRGSPIVEPAATRAHVAPAPTIAAPAPLVPPPTAAPQTPTVAPVAVSSA
jgi:hypothetical protein